MTLLGRQAECHHLDEILTGAKRGRAGALLIVGEPGIGKSTLLEHARGRSNGMTVLTTCGNEAESDLPFSGLLDLMRPLLPLLPTLPEMRARALSGALALAPAAPGDRFAVAAAAWDLVAAGAERTPLLILVDDAHWLDAASLETVLFVARRLSHEPVALLLASRTDEPALAGSGVCELQLGGLHPGEAAALLNGTAVPEIAARLIEAAHGNPLALAELSSRLSAEELAGREPLPEPLPVGAAVARGFLHRVERLPPPTRRALVVAAAGDADDAAAVAAALGALGLADALAEAENTGLLTAGGRLRFRHPLVRSSVYEAASPDERRRAHTALAAALHRPGQRERRARHLAAAAIGPDEETAAAIEQAAQTARGRSGYAAAAALLERAAQLTPGREPRLRRLLEAADAARLGGRPALALRLLDDAAAQSDDPLLLADVAGLRAAVASADGTLRVVSPTWVATEAEAVRAIDPARAALLFATAAQFHAHRGNRRAALVAAERSASLTDPPTAASPLVLLRTAHALLLCGRVHEARRLGDAAARELGDAAYGLAEEARAHAALRMWLEDHEDALDALTRQAEVARRRGALGPLPQILDTLAAVEFRLGHWLEARIHSTESLDLAEATGQRGQAGSTLTTLARLEAASGDEAACRAHVEEALRLARRTGNGMVEAWALSALGLLELGLGRTDEAVAALEHLARGGSRVTTPPGSAAVSWSTDLAEAYVRAGHHEEAERLAAVLVAAVTECDLARVRAAAARVQAIVAEADAFEQLFAESLRQYEAVTLPFERARTLLALGERRRRARRRLEARPPLREALVEFERLGAAPWAARARAELQTTGERARIAPAPLVETLTPQELQVAVLVGRGMTNREAAAAVFVSPKTIEAHLGRVYRKLGLRSRTELAGVLARSHDP